MDSPGEDLVASFNAAYDANEFSISKGRIVITLHVLSKEDGSLSELSNRRSITLQNVHCKLATNVIVNRIESSLPSLVHSDQTDLFV